MREIGRNLTFLRAIRWSLRKALSDWNKSHTASFLFVSKPEIWINLMEKLKFYSSLPILCSWLSAAGKVKVSWLIAGGETFSCGVPGAVTITLQVNSITESICISYNMYVRIPSLIPYCLLVCEVGEVSG